ncbi:MAG: rhodanese-like domain-containing protein [Candidatus Goldiibacteriota bacterium]
MKKNKKKIKKSKTAPESGKKNLSIKNKAMDILKGAVIITAAAAAVGVFYTGMRVLAGIDIVAESGSQSVSASDNGISVSSKKKKYKIPSEYKYLFSEVSAKNDIPKIHIKEAKVLFESGRALFIDARSEGEYNKAHIPGAVYISSGYSPQKIKEYEKQLKDKVLVPYCHGTGCRLSDRVAYKLFDMGYRNIVLFFGGWPEWKQADMPVKEYEPPEKYKHLLKEAGSVSGIPDITLDEAKFLYDKSLANFVDVDTREKYAEERISRAVSLPLDKIKDMLPGYKAFLEQKPVVVYCHGRGGQSEKAVKILYEAGHKKVLRFPDALKRWKKADYPIYKNPRRGR